MMKVRKRFSWVALLVISGVVPASAQKPAGPPSVAHLPLWTVKGYFTGELVPGLTGALLLTSEQREQLALSWQESSGSAAVAGAIRTLKSYPGATEAEKQAARALVEAAAARLQQRIDTVLTGDQRKLVEWIDSLYAEAGKSTGAQMEPAFAAAKGVNWRSRWH
jgi:hypothetical protein